jgi:cobalamin biosynthesis Mg chelatase CobN
MPYNEMNDGNPGTVMVPAFSMSPTAGGSVIVMKYKVLKTNTTITATLEEMLYGEDDTEVSSQMTTPTLTINSLGRVSSNTKITPATTAPATTKAAAPVTQAPATQNNQQNNHQNNSQQPAQSDNSAASNSSANSNAQTNANTTANSTPAVTTQVAAQTENTVPEIATNATEAVSENTDAMTVGADEKKSIIPLIVALVAALASLAAIIFIIVKKKKESDEGEEQSNPEK